MPDQPSWIERLPEILDELQAPGAPPFLDRSVVEKLFRLRRRRAIDLLGLIGGYKLGKTYLAPREAVVRFLTAPQRRSAAAQESGRFEQVQLALGEARHELAQHHILVPDVPGVEFAGLPDGIRFEPGQLILSFEQPAELIEKLIALAQALTNDYETFERSLAAQALAPQAGAGGTP
jgi:hypothetical protein